MTAYRQTPVSTSAYPTGQVDPQTAEENRILEKATAILERRMKTKGIMITEYESARRYVAARTANYNREVFGVLWLTNRHRVIEVEELFFGTIDSASVHAREVVRSALSLNAGAAILFHNHPAGDPTPSSADRVITQTLAEALNPVGVKVIDHIVAANGDTASMAARGEV
ncbi:DNA repair protein RadC [Marinobacter halodurans]|uniref:DNA repair protein RadC n=1 Tax=Marinobacter halodurans TaxID=2528979 RepID=A0ABY1ZMD0_9GAMM|nr:JAB domain-containing protein [Marinobacter halodurans]TBW57468.1 DNA repair protein RadC [Marinobacter halodurans]